MKFFNLNLVSTIILITASSLLTQKSLANTFGSWPFANNTSQNNQVGISQYYYVGQGESWNNIIYNGQISTDKNIHLIVSYDDQQIYKTDLVTGTTDISFKIPNSKSGFHRLNFITQPDSHNFINDQSLCQIDNSNKIMTLESSALSYQVIRQNYLLKNLPDALYNPKLSSTEPLTVALQFNQQNITEKSMIARLLSSWEQSRPLQWITADTATEKVNFAIIVKKNTQIKTARLELTIQNDIPTLQIEYRSLKNLEAAINALLEPTYLQQLNTQIAELPNTSIAPQWATVKSFNNLADFGIESFRLGDEKKALTLNFPATWQPIDILQGQIALRSQSGLLEGSVINAWINGALAGSMKLVDLESDSVDRQFNIFGADIPNSSIFNLVLENTIIANSKCIPHAQGFIWVNTEKSKITLPYKQKSGVINLSTILATNPYIAVNENLGSSSMATTVMQTAKNMLLTAAPVPLTLYRFDPQTPQKVNIRVNPEIYNQQVLMHKDIIYSPTAAHGFFVIYQHQRFNIITDDYLGADAFNILWPRIQNQIPNDAAKIFVSSDGKIYLLKKIPVSNSVENPLIKESNFFIISIAVVVVVILLLIIIIIRNWRKRKNETKNE